MKYSVSSNVLQDILNYMANRPYTEVAALIVALQQDAKVIESSQELNVVEKVAE